MKDYQKLERDILGRLDNDLDPALKYHTARHTRDVMESTLRLAKAENISEAETHLLRVAALMHDVGFLRSFEDHEKHGADLAREILPEYGYNKEEIEVVARLIMATRVPQQPTDLLEHIICDADLDYLGRPDFFEVGNRLFKEFLARKIVNDFCEWDKVQVSFLGNHQYFTETARATRAELKATHLQAVKDRLAACIPNHIPTNL